MDGSLKDIIKEKKKLTSDEAIGIMKEITSKYKFLYDQKLMHLNIKPQNILYTVNEKG